MYKTMEQRMAEPPNWVLDHDQVLRHAETGMPVDLVAVARLRELYAKEASK